jgi:hypothetical protein
LRQRKLSGRQTWTPIGDELEELLALAASDFINDPNNVEIDYDDKVVQLSKIFKWYKDDFVNYVRLGGKPIESGLLTYVGKYAVGDLADDVGRASDYTIEFRDYDWNLNSAH